MKVGSTNVGCLDVIRCIIFIPILYCICYEIPIVKPFLDKILEKEDFPGLFMLFTSIYILYRVLLAKIRSLWYQRRAREEQRKLTMEYIDIVIEVFLECKRQDIDDEGYRGFRDGCDYAIQSLLEIMQNHEEYSKYSKFRKYAKCAKTSKFPKLFKHPK